MKMISLFTIAFTLLFLTTSAGATDIGTAAEKEGNLRGRELGKAEPWQCWKATDAYGYNADPTYEKLSCSLICPDPTGLPTCATSQSWAKKLASQYCGNDTVKFRVRKRNGFLCPWQYDCCDL